MLFRHQSCHRVCSAFFQFMEEQFVELRVCSFDLTAVYRFAPIEHVHEQARVAWRRLGRGGKHLNFSLGEWE